MKLLLQKIFLFLAIMFLGKIHSQNIHDTLFIKKNINQKIYIESNKKSGYYQDINNFKDFKEIDKKDKISQLGLAAKWVRLYKYEKQYFLYAPCDWMYDTKIVIDDQRIQFKNSEVVSFNIKAIKKIEENIIIKYRKPFVKKNNVLKIAPIDKEKGIYQFTEGNNEGFKYIMLEADKYQNFKILVNECINSKMEEFEFEK